ncbi:MAG: HAD family hydrolase, partial [Nitrospinota bacterium]
MNAFKTGLPNPVFDAVVFDQDGTVVDSMEVIYRAFVNTVRRFAHREVSRGELLAAMGPPEEKMLERRLPKDAFPEAVEFFFGHYERPEAGAGAGGGVRLFPGMEEALDRLREGGVRLGLFTGKGRQGTRSAFGGLNLGRWFTATVTGDDVERYKPDPEGVFKALSELGVPAERALVVGDSPYDVLAGRAAGSKTGLALWGVSEAARLEGIEADFRFRRPADVVRAVLGLKEG